MRQGCPAGSVASLWELVVESPGRVARPRGMTLTRLLALLLVTLLCAGCGGTASCPPGSGWDSAMGRCVALPGDGGLADAGVADAAADGDLVDASVLELGPDDAGRDLGGGLDLGGPDEGPDGGEACGGACGGASPVCEPLTDTCVACIVDDNCPAAAPRCNDANECVGCLSHADCQGGRCDPAAARCVECLTNADCGHLASSRCDPTTLTCSPCLSAADCGHIAGRPACVEGQCGPCHPTLGDDCGIYSCSQVTLECSDSLRGWSDVYTECEASSECTWGPCVRQGLVGPDRHVCTVWPNPDGCGWTFPVSQARTSIHGELVEICMLRENWLTYEAAQLWMHYWRDNIASPDVAGYRCATNSDCPFGTYCRPMHFRHETAPTNHCTITGCTGNPECPSPLTCRSGDPGQPNYCAIWNP